MASHWCINSEEESPVYRIGINVKKGSTLRMTVVVYFEIDALCPGHYEFIVQMHDIKI